MLYTRAVVIHVRLQQCANWMATGPQQTDQRDSLLLSQVLCFAILDILAKVVWSTIIFNQHEKIALT